MRAISNLRMITPRNHALLSTGRAWRLSPAYGLDGPLPTIAIDRRDLRDGLRNRAAGPLPASPNLLAGAGRFPAGWR